MESEGAGYIRVISSGEGKTLLRKRVALSRSLFDPHNWAMLGDNDNTLPVSNPVRKDLLLGQCHKTFVEISGLDGFQQIIW